MTQYSQPWDGIAIGDAAARAPYNQGEWDDIFEAILNSGVANYENYGVVRNFLDELVVSGVATPLAVTTGAAFVKGKWYINDAATTVAVTSPAGATRTDYIALECDWTGLGTLTQQYTIRLVNLQGVEGAGVPPALVQTDLSIWQIPIAIISVTVGGVITVTDDRWFLNQFHDRVVQLYLGGHTSGAGISQSYAFSYENLVVYFDDAAQGLIGWVIDVDDWNENLDILVRFSTMNDVQAAGVKAGNSHWLLNVSQIGVDCQDPTSYKASDLPETTVTGGAAFHIADLDFAIRYADGFRRAYGPISITLERLYNDPLDTSTTTWVIFSGKAVIPN